MTNLVKGKIEFDCGHDGLGGFFAVNDLGNFFGSQNLVTEMQGILLIGLL